MSDLVKRGLFAEFRYETKGSDGEAGTARVRQMLLFDQFMFTRNISTENPQRHWKWYRVVEEGATPEDAHTALREWIKDVINQFDLTDYTLTQPPFLLEATHDEYEKIRNGETPRNIVLRVDRVRKSRGLPVPTELSTPSAS